MNSTINISFLKKYNPVKATVFGLLLWVFLIVIFPLKVKYELSFFPVLYVILNYLFLLMGLKSLSNVIEAKTDSYKVDYDVLKKIMYIIITIALIGFILKVIDKFYLRDTSFGNSMSENRELLSQSGPSIISIISAVTNPFSFIPLFIYFFIKSKSKLLFWLCLFLFFSAAVEFIVLGSRSGLFILLILFGLYLFYFKKLRLSIGRIVALFIFGSVLFIYSVNLFIERTNDFTLNEQKSIEHILTKANYNFTLEPTKATKKSIINSNNRTYQAAYLGVTNFVQYYVHGMYEFGYMYNNYDKSHHYGAFTFGVFAKFINIIFGTDIDLKTIQISPPRSGIYTTFFGPIFMDFGWLSLIFMYFFGVFQKSIYNKVLKGRFQFTPLLFYILIINFFMPVINFINGAQGLYTIVSFVLFATIYTLLSGKLIISRKNGKEQFIKILKSQQ